MRPYLSGAAQRAKAAAFLLFFEKAGGGIFTARPGAGRNRMPQKNAPDAWGL